MDSHIGTLPLRIAGTWHSTPIHSTPLHSTPYGTVLWDSRKSSFPPSHKVTCESRSIHRTREQRAHYLVHQLDSKTKLVSTLHITFLLMSCSLGAGSHLQPSPQAHLIISHFSGRGGCICQTWIGSTRWVLVLWGRSKYHDSSNVFIWQCWCTLIGRLRAGSCPTAIASSASDHFPFFWDGELHLSNLERVALR